MDDWRLIIDPPGDGPENMATDEALLAGALAGGVCHPTLRVYGWSEPYISIGCLQDPAPLVPSGLPIVRRPTGGRALIHDVELTYSIVAGSVDTVFSGGIMDAYSRISGCIAAALRDVGIGAEFSSARAGYAKTPACFNSSSRYELLVGGRKIAGSAQRRLKDHFLQHGSILFGIDRALNASVFSEGMVEKMTCVSDFSTVGVEEFRTVLIRRMSEGLDAVFAPGALTGAETELKARLLRLKYSRREWNLGTGRSAPAHDRAACLQAGRPGTP